MGQGWGGEGGGEAGVELEDPMPFPPPPKKNKVVTPIPIKPNRYRRGSGVFRESCPSVRQGAPSPSVSRECWYEEQDAAPLGRVPDSFHCLK